ncbi:VOC family protein [Pseudomonas sp. UBA6323]|uniref:VOC family protein n=1 Tax=Pseudomonas sp. UBA6323 TaxID=1947329 RepID=UPI0025F35D90|nr:VOC family protein [Pseudomonas sp. UBA6323]
MPAHEKINYVEYPSRNLPATKAFFQTAFGWRFTDYGPDYAAFADEGLDGGFFSAEMSARSDSGSALIVFYSAKLEETLAKVEAAGQTDLFLPWRQTLSLRRTGWQRVCRMVGAGRSIVAPTGQQPPLPCAGEGLESTMETICNA